MAANAEIEKGDVLATSGIDGMYPRGPAGRARRAHRARRGLRVRQDRRPAGRGHRPAPTGAGARADRRHAGLVRRPGPRRPQTGQEQAPAPEARLMALEAPGQQYLLLPAKGSFIVASLLVALAFNLLPWQDVRGVPDLLAVVIAFWCIHQPRKMGIGAAWVLGLVMDAANGTLLRPVRARLLGARVCRAVAAPPHPLVPALAAGAARARAARRDPAPDARGPARGRRHLPRVRPTSWAASSPPRCGRW